MPTEANKAIVRSYFERAINQGDLDWLEQIIAPGFGADEASAHMRAASGPERVRAMIRRYRQAFPDIQYTIQDMLAEGDRVVVQVTFRGTQRGQFMGVAPTGRVVNGSGVELAILADGQITAAGWQYHDELGLLRQLGALPAGGHAAHGRQHDQH